MNGGMVAATHRDLRGEQIPLVARIFSIVDVWDGLRENRPYHQGIPENEVLEYLKGQSGIQFDPEIVRAFVDLLIEEGYLLPYPGKKNELVKYRRSYAHTQARSKKF